MNKPHRRLGSPPDDWSSSDIARRSPDSPDPAGADLGGPPPSFGASAPARPGLLTAVLVAEDRTQAAALAFELAEARAGIRLAFSVDDVAALLPGAGLLVALVPAAHHPIARRLAEWGEGRTVIALVPDRDTALQLAGRADAALEPPWRLEKIVRELSSG